MSKRSGRPRNLGLVFEHFSDLPRPTFHLDRPLDIAPDGGTSYGVADLADMVERMSGSLYAAGLRDGQNVVILKRNHIDTLLLAAAAARLGALPVMISPTLAPDDLRVLVTRAAPTVIVSTPQLLTRAFPTSSDVPAQTSVVTLHDPEQRAGGADELEFPAGAAVIPLGELRDASVPPPRPRPDSEPMICTHTSGTTGVPKLTVHSADTICGEIMRLESMRWAPWTAGRRDISASCMPFVHARPVTWLVGQLVCPPDRTLILSEPDPARAAEVFTEHRPTIFEACPNVFLLWEELAERRPELFARVRMFNSTFDAVHPRTVRRFLTTSRRRFPTWTQGWGQSEVGGIAFTMYTRRQLRRHGAEAAAATAGGRPVPGVHMRVVDPETNLPVRRGEPGMVLVRTPALCLTYLGEPERHGKKSAEGWWNTGDLGIRRSLGRLSLLDREVDMIPGIGTIELESILLDRLPTLNEVIVLGVPGRPPVPVLCPRDGATLDPAAWRDAVRGLPELDEPRTLPWDEFPRTGTWKVRRQELREKLLATGDRHGSGIWT